MEQLVAFGRKYTLQSEQLQQNHRLGHLEESIGVSRDNLKF